MARRTMLGLAAALALAGCKNDTSASSESSIASKLTKAFGFSGEMLLDAPMPATTDGQVKLLPLGATPVVYPGGGGLMALEVDDPDSRDVIATLMQFGGDNSHLRVPAPEAQSGNVVENEFSLSDTLCADLCDAIFTITVVEKVELQGHVISSATTREVVLDCRKKGNHAACQGDTGAGADIQQSDSMCGDVTKGAIALSGNTVLDSHLDALRQLGLLTTALGKQVGDTLAELALAAGIDKGSSAPDVAMALAMRVQSDTAAGLSAVLGAPGCAIRLSQLEFALMACDPDNVASLKAIDCTGVCEPESDPAACKDAAMSGCHGLIESQACSGSCVGACQAQLAQAAPCAGTCIGMCDGNCPEDGNGGCAGPCDGNCTGECRKTSNGMCDADCTGVCDETASGTPSCEAPLAAYCGDAMTTLTCPGDCFGDVALTKGAAACRKSAVSIARCVPRCAPPLLQLSFAFKMGLDGAAQSALTKLVQDLNAPLASLIDAQARLALLQATAADLALAQEGEIADQLQKLKQDSPKDDALACADKQLAKVPTWLTDQKNAITKLQDDIMQLLAVFTTAP